MSDPAPPGEARRRETALDRARRDLAAGRPDLARDRLTGFLYTLHRQGEYNQEAYLLLGKVLFAMRDLPQAGAAWLLTERHGPDVDEAVQAFHKRYGRDPLNVLRALKPRAPSEKYPPAVQERLKNWGYRYRPYRPRSNPHAEHELDAEPAHGLRPMEFGCLAALFALAAAGAFWLWLSVRAR